MRLTLHYRGPLKSNGSPQDKHEIRRVFHAQLSNLWSQQPLTELREFLGPKDTAGNYSLQRPMGKFTFIPLIAAEMNSIAELQISLLRPEPPGNILTQGGDMDNRLKTLFDALTMPRQEHALPKNAKPVPDEDPFFFCLLEDDNLVTRLAVDTQQLLEPGLNPSIVDLSIVVQTRTTRVTLGNGAWA